MTQVAGAPPTACAPCPAPALKVEAVVGATPFVPAAPLTAFEQRLVSDCNAGDVSECVYLASLFESGRGSFGTDLVRAAQLRASACDAGALEGCHELGQSYFDGRGVPRDPARGIALMRRACDASPNDCYFLGSALEKDGPTQDIWGAIEAYKRECGVRSGVSCSSIGDLLVGGKVPKDVPAAIGWYETACELGYEGGCSELAELFEAGEHTPPQPAKTLKFRKRACELGTMWECDKLRK